jgi:hypothetical protein
LWFSATNSTAINEKKLHVQGHAAPVFRPATPVCNKFTINDLGFFVVEVPHLVAGRCKNVTRPIRDFLTKNALADACRFFSRVRISNA